MMQGSGLGLFAASGVLLLTLNGSPILFWIAIISIVLATVFLVFAVLKRRNEAREARSVPRDAAGGQSIGPVGREAMTGPSPLQREV